MSIPYEVRKRVNGELWNVAGRELIRMESIDTCELICPRLRRNLFGSQIAAETFTILFALFHSQP